MTMISADVKAPGGIDGSGSTLVVDHTTDNALMAFRFKLKDVKMLAAEDDFELKSHKFRAGAFIIPNADRAKIEPVLRDLGLNAMAVSSAPTVKTHDLDVPRIGYIHSWQRTQDEGWVRAALDYYGVPYTYFADQKLREGNLRAKYDVIIFPHVGGNSPSHLTGIPMTGKDPVPYKKSDLTPNLGANDSSDDIRGGMGIEGLAELTKFVQEGGTLITEGSTAAFLSDYGLTSGVTVEHPAGLFARGSILRGYLHGSQEPDRLRLRSEGHSGVLQSGPGAERRPAVSPDSEAGGGGSPLGQNVTPNAVPVQISPYDSTPTNAGPPAPSEAENMAIMRQQARAFGVALDETRPRVVMQFPANPNDMLLSGTLSGGQALSNRALAVDVTAGKGHIVMFALRPFWRWQTQGTYFLAFNAILNWNHLDAGKAAPQASPKTGAAQ